MTSGNTVPADSVGGLLLVVCKTSAPFEDIFARVTREEVDESESESLSGCNRITSSGCGKSGGDAISDGSGINSSRGSSPGDSGGDEIGDENSKEGGDEFTARLPERVLASSEAAGFRGRSELKVTAMVADDGRISENTQTESALFVAYTPRECEATGTRTESELFVAHTPCANEATGMVESVIANMLSEHEAN
jgi:hypothetical protein